MESCGVSACALLRRVCRGRAVMSGNWREEYCMASESARETCGKLADLEASCAHELERSEGNFMKVARHAEAAAR